MVDANGNWKIQLLSNFLSPTLLQRISSPAPCLEGGSDVHVWPGTRLGLFSVSSAYQMLQGYHILESESICKKVWRMDVSERIKCFAWQLIHGKLTTNKVCSRWGHGSPFCDHCSGVEETNIHVMRDCQHARLVWNHTVPVQGRLVFFVGDYNDWIVQNI
ncbi:hypothetical protein TSUD_367660 [Trifolium subterraneum]|uniref:Reverse transcriptase zinc-binding domain-containing protein n=1 Tax=Trifolium subterraneum TaxID=3900 RepID=A0A2Z6PDV8_TRISU|nr:hypothetical protein TSUD_367660 [Trifolium subterraneum]